MNFKQQADNDIKKVFHNLKEFADTKEIYYDGKIIKAKVVIDYSERNERSKAGSDNAEGLFNNDVLLYISLEELGKVPRKGMEIEFDQEIYEITKVKNEMGELILYLARLSE